MNGDMPHVPITTLAGIASLTDLLNQLPLPSPLPATTTKSLLFGGRIAEDVNCLMGCRDESLVSQLVHSLSQVSTDHIELKDNLGSDDPEGDIPVLLQAVLARNPNVFREKSMQNRYGVQSGIMQQQIIQHQQYKLPQNSIHGSPASSTFQQSTISHSPSSRFVPPQSSSANRYMTQQNSPAPSPYAPQSPPGYIQYPQHPPSYTQHQQIQQELHGSPLVSGPTYSGSPQRPVQPCLIVQTQPSPQQQQSTSTLASVSSPMIPSGMRNIHDSKVASQMSGSSSNHHSDNSRHGSNEDYIHMVHRLGSELLSFSSLAGSTPLECEIASRPPLILQSPPPYTSPRDAPPDILLDSPDRMGSKKKTKKAKLTKEEKEQADKTAMYDIVSSPSKDCTKLTLRLTRVRDQQDDMLPNMDSSTENEAELNNIQFPEQTAKQPGTHNDIHGSMNVSAQCVPQQEQAFLQAQQGTALQQNNAIGTVKTAQTQPQPLQQQSQQTMTPYDEVELDALAEIERIERESAMERERCSKEVQDKDKPLKKRKQDSFPQETAGGGGGGANRPALLVSIDLQHAGRTDGQAAPPLDSENVKKSLELVRQSTEVSLTRQDDTLGVLKPKPENHPDISRRKSENEGQKDTSRPDVIKPRPETPKQKSEIRPETPKGKHDNRRDVAKSTPEKRLEISKHKHEGKSEHTRMKAESRSETPKPRHEGRQSSDIPKDKRELNQETQKQKSDEKNDSERGKLDASKVRRPDTPKLIKNESDCKPPRNETPKNNQTDCSKSVKIEKKARSDSGDRGDRGDRSERRSPEEHRLRSESPRVKQDNRESGKIKSEMKDRTALKQSRRSDVPAGSLSSKDRDERRSEGSKVKPETLNTLSDKEKFPSYLLGGGRSNALKNFVIPKIKRDKDGNVCNEQKELRKSVDKNELKLKVEKMDLVEDLKKVIKPVVVLHKLPFDEVQKFIKDNEDKNASRSSSKSKSRLPSKPSKGGIDQSVLKELPPDLLAEIESTMPLCERVKMNKRKRSTVKEKPNYAEISSDEGDNDSDFESSRKRHKKDRGMDKAWECEERDRRILNEIRRSSYSIEGRRSSGSRYRECSPGSEEDSPPPSLIDIAKKMRKREKQKKRKAYEPKLTPEEMMDSSTFKRFTATVENILENLEDMDFTTLGEDDELPQELLLGKQQLNELSSESAKIKAMGIMDRLPTDKMVKVLSILEKNIQDGAKLSTLFNHVSSMGITPFFVENVSELQLCGIKLVTAVFSRYEKHRQLILEEMFASLAKLPTSKRSLRNFRLNSSDMDGEPLFIQMVTALVLQLIQCVVHLPTTEKDSNTVDDDGDKKVDQDVLITNSYETAMRTAQNFLSVFLKKCGSKQGEEDYRPLFENFVQDLLSTVNKPEWPAAELLLSLLGRLLVHQFSNKSTEMALRVASLDYLGTVAARLRKDAVSCKMDRESIDRILKQVSGIEDEVQQLQKALLDYLDENTETDPSLMFARKFYIAQWFRDTTMETEKAMKSQNQKDDDSSDGAQHAKEVESTGEIMQRAEKRKKFLRSVIKTAPAQFSTLRMTSANVDYEDACLIVRYLASMRPFAQSFDIYLTQILRVLGESAIAVRTKAMKCLSEVVAVDPSILARLDMQRGVHGRLMDNSTSVREAAVELLGRFVLSRPQLTEQYYDMLIERILDTGISVRKRVIKILRDICIEQPTFSKVTEMCVRMIRRVNDEEGIKKLVNETFQKLWFTPTPSHDAEGMTRKILNVTDVVAACRDTGYDWFEQLLQNLLKSEEDASYKPVKKACVQIVDNLVEHILKYEESLADSDSKGMNTNCLVACLITLYLFSKIQPHLMVKHAMTLQPYLTTKCNTQSDFLVICNVAKILELVVPLMEHPSETFLATIEEDLMKLILKHGMTVVQHCVSCLGAVVNRVTHNFKFVWACFNRYYGALTKLKAQHQEDSSNTALVGNKPALLRSLFTVGALCRNFDFDQEEFKGNTKVVIKEKVLELLLYFTKHEDEEVQTKAIIGLGFVFIQHPDLMFEQDVKNLYNNILRDKEASIGLKIQVLKNLQTYLQEEDCRMQQADKDWKKVSKQEDLKEMGDISSGMSSSIMQLYLKQVLEAFFHTHSPVRHFALNVIALTLNQGLVHPVQCVPYLIAIGTDPESAMRNKSDQQLVEIDKKYTGFVHMKAVAGMKMSYQLQQSIQSEIRELIRGFRQEENVTALCSHLYSMIRGNRQHRRAFLIALLNLFDDSAKTEVNLLLYIADNLACFPFQTQEEPLFIMHHIDITLSVSGSNLLQSFRESLLKDTQPKERKCSSSGDSDSEDEMQRPRKSRKRINSDSSDDEDDDLEDVLARLPADSTPLVEFVNASQGILLLLVLKQHLKNLYGFSDSKIQKYSPSESAKVYDKAVNRKSGVHFNPRQTLDFLRNGVGHAEITETVKRNIVKQYLDFKTLMEHLDPDEEDEDGEVSASTAARNKAINALLGGSSPKNNAETDDEESDGEERAGGGIAGATRRSKRLSEPGDLGAQLHEAVEVMDVIAICCPKYKDRPQIARVVEKTSSGFSVHWMAGSYSGSWTEAKRREGRKLVPWVDSIKESDIIYKKIALTSANKLTNKVVQTLRSLYAAKEGSSC
ncbi:nipped-B-like protein B [Rhincodon typus]|uniref:nipped-B-like protein B n=1 Tax=Rhincodon typus TaxID=259920 RepID=UPI00202F66CC|nr:nipped-B-like protein B [Rhincodon typus]